MVIIHQTSITSHKDNDNSNNNENHNDIMIILFQIAGTCSIHPLLRQYMSVIVAKLYVSTLLCQQQLQEQEQEHKQKSAEYKRMVNKKWR